MGRKYVVFADADTLLRAQSKPPTSWSRAKTEERWFGWPQGDYYDHERKCVAHLTDSAFEELTNWSWRSIGDIGMLRYSLRHLDSEPLLVIVTANDAVKSNVTQAFSAVTCYFNRNDDFEVVASAPDFVTGVRLWLASAGPDVRSVVISAHDYTNEFGSSSIVVQRNSLSRASARVIYCLTTAPWFEHTDCLQESERGYALSCKEGEPYSVVFLDVDGVLNDADVRYQSGVVIDAVCMDLLKEICNKGYTSTIVLTGSWREPYRQFMCSGCVSDDTRMKTLHDELERCGLEVGDVTPYAGFEGDGARAAEIRGWLMRHPGVRRFVILDDDCYWSWGCLGQCVVETQDENHVRGLTEKHVQKAIEILRR